MDTVMLRDFLAAFDGFDLDAEVYAAGGICGDVSIYVDNKEVWASDA